LWSADAGASNRGPDFDNDDKDDIALGVFHEDIGTTGGTQAGAVHILYGGSATGLHDKASRLSSIYRSVSGVEGDIADFGGFGHTLAWGDFDGDCFDDLVVGDTDEAIQVFYGSSTGLSTADDEIFQFFLGGHFEALAAGDFNGDGFDDIAAGNPEWDDSGAVLILYGSVDGLDTSAGPSGMQVLDHVELGLVSHNVTAPDFAKALAAGDFNCDGVDDLAIGAQHEHSSAMTTDAAGAVYVVYGQFDDPLGSSTVQTWRQGSNSVKETPESFDEFGWSLAVGNFNGDTSPASGLVCHDLAIGAWGEDLSATDAGLVHVLYGQPGTGLQATSPDDQVWHRDDPNILGTPNLTDIFGYAIVAGNLDGDNFEELIIGVPNDSSVTVIRGSSTGLVNTNDLMWTQATTNVPGDEALGETFGGCLTYGQRWHPDTDSGVAVCNPSKTVDEVSNAGMLHALYINNEFIEAFSAGWEQSDIDASLIEEYDQFPTTTAAPRDRPFTCD